MKNEYLNWLINFYAAIEHNPLATATRAVVVKLIREEVDGISQKTTR